MIRDTLEAFADVGRMMSHYFDGTNDEPTVDDIQQHCMMNTEDSEEIYNQFRKENEARI